MEQPAIGRKAPIFTLPASDGSLKALQHYIGTNVVLYFYPKDMTPGCTQESCEFRDFHGEFGKLNTVILGVSPDDLPSHDQFIQEYGLPFLLLADVDQAVCKLYGVWKLRERDGVQFMGVERSTFLIDAQGTLAKEWRRVTVDGHVVEVLEAVKNLQSA